MSKPSTSATVSSKANLCALFLLSAALSCLGQSAGYKTIFLGENTSAVALNNRGEVLVCSNSPDGQQFLKMWSTNSGFNQLPVIPNLYIQPNSLNDAGYFAGFGFGLYGVVGVVYVADQILILTNGLSPCYIWTNGDFTGTWSAYYPDVGSWESHAFVSLQGKVFGLPEPSTNVQSQARWANSSGKIVGTVQGDDGNMQGVVWDSITNQPELLSQLSDITSGLTQIQPYRINAQNSILFSGVDSNWTWGSYLLSATNVSAILPPGLNWASAIDLDNNNHILCSGSDSNWVTHYGILDNGVFTEIRTGARYQVSGLSAVNDQGWVIGNGMQDNVWGSMVLIPATPPTISLSGETNFMINATVTAEANVTKVELYMLNKLYSTATSTPFVFPLYFWTNGTFDVFGISYDDGGLTSTSATAQAVVELPATDPPADFPIPHAYALGPSTNMVTWRCATNVFYYEIKCITDSHTNLIARCAANETAFVDANAPLSGNLTYRIIAINSAGQAVSQITLNAMNVSASPNPFRGNGIGLLVVGTLSPLQVEFLESGRVLGTATNAPFVFVSPSPSGGKTYYVRITDSSGSTRILQVSSANSDSDGTALQVFRPN